MKKRIAGSLYYSFISSDSETALVTNTFTLMSVVYTVLITAFLAGISALIKRLEGKKHD